MKRLTLFTAMMLFVGICQAQISFTGLHKYDGEHKNEISGYVMGGHNVVVGAFGGLEASYKRHFTDRWHAGADVQAQFSKQLYSVDVQGGYQRWGANEMIANLAVTWETPYIYLRVGESYIHYHILDFGYTEPLTLTFGFGLNIRPRTNPWNIGLFFRNYDDFYYENWNINWGLDFYTPLVKDIQLFGELNIRPAGSMSQLASKYETSGKLGIKYVW